MTEIIIYEAKNRRHPTLKEYGEVFQKLDWFKREHITLWFHGHDGNQTRDGRTEVKLKEFREKGKLQARWYDGRWVYSVKRINRGSQDKIPDHIYHGLGVTEGLVRFYLSDKSAEIVPPGKFPGIRPDGVIRYPTRTVLYEFCTEDNTRRRLKQKIKAYKELEGFVVVFVLDVTDVTPYVDGPFYFITYKTFTSIPYGQQLTAPHYIWGGDGKVYSLR